MVINKFCNLIQLNFEIFGYRDGVWEKYSRDGRYEAFMVRRGALHLRKGRSSRRGPVKRKNGAHKRHSKYPHFDEYCRVKTEKAMETLSMTGFPREIVDGLK
jgi:hypothetical protein